MDIEQKEYLRLQTRLIKRFNKACATYQLIADGDHILVGLSGGKDSLALVEFLGKRQKIFVPRFKVSAAHVIVENIGYQSDAEYLQDFCKENGVDFHLVRTRYEEQTDTKTHQQKSHCFLCSWYRRKALFSLAEQLQCNKLALGHHQDDIVETLLMNLIFTGSLSTIMPMLQMERFPLRLIRPLCLMQEKELRCYAELSHYREVPKLCPFEHDSSRADMKQLVSQLEQLNPDIRESIWHAIQER